MIILGIETSCDETAVSVCKNGEILSNIISSQEVHNKYGGVVPEIASREHEKVLNVLTEKAITSAEINKDEIENRLDIISFFIKKRKVLDNLRSELKKNPRYGKST